MKIVGDITNCILGAKGSGKSVLLADTLNQYPGKAVLFDILGVYNPRNKHKTAIVPNSYYCLSGEDFIQNVDKFPAGAKIIISLEHYIGSDLIDIVDKISKLLMERKEPICVLSDEVADFMPQQGRYSVEFHRLVKNGRNYGIKPVEFATQRPQSVNKNIFDLCDKFLISAQKAPKTIDYIIDILDSLGDDNLKSTIAGLQKREFLIYDGVSLERYKVPDYPYAFVQ